MSFLRRIHVGKWAEASIRWKTNVRVELLLLLVLIFAYFVNGYIDCPFEPPPPATATGIFDFREPDVFVTTGSQNFDPYSLVDRHRRTTIFNEYLMMGYKQHDAGGVYETLHMVVYDGADVVDENVLLGQIEPDLVHQNLEKKLYWEYFNSTGVNPSVTVINTTMKFQSSFHTKHFYNETSKIRDTIALHSTLMERAHLQEPQVPLDAIFEIPVGSRVLRKAKTMIEFNTFTLWRWKLSNKTATWDEIEATFATTEPGIPSVGTTPGSAVPDYDKFLQQIDNPCTKDMFLVYVFRKDPKSNESFFYVGSPLIQSHMQEAWFYDMTSGGQLWENDTFENMVLTNDHLVALTDNALYISASLNVSQEPYIRENHTERPLLKYEESNPCEKYEGNIVCFYPNGTPPANESDPCPSTRPHKVFYNPVCYLYQFPNYDDYLIFVTGGSFRGEGFSAFYSPKPYADWKLLFGKVEYYVKTKADERWEVRDIVGIFFNHHLRQFDITVKIYGPISSKTPKCRFTRFALPEPVTFGDGYGEPIPNTDRKQLRDVMGNGFLDFDFPAGFEINSVRVNSLSMDVFFLGNQLWIAEAGGPFIYASLTGLSEVKESICNGSTGGPGKAIIHDCSFNHPDRTYLCLNEDRRLILAGRIGSAYSPVVVEMAKIGEIENAQQVNGWPKDYFCTLLQRKSVLVAGFSGKILVWYMHQPKTLATAQTEALQNSAPCNDTEPVVCKLIHHWKDKGCKGAPDGEESKFRMLSIEPIRFTPRKRTTDGPLVPFFIDSNSAILFEAIVPPYRDNYYVYFSEGLGLSKLWGMGFRSVNDSNNPTLQHNCELFMRHIKPVEGFLDGFRRCLYVSIIKSIPIVAIPADIVVLVHAQSNRACVKIDDVLNNPPWEFKTDHTGQTLYLPGNFSILLTGFPKTDASGGVDRSMMEGFTTMYFEHSVRVVYNAYYSFLVDMSTQTFRKVHEDMAAETIQMEKERLAAMDEKKQKQRDDLIAERKRIQDRWELSPFSADQSGVKLKIFTATLTPNVEKQEDIERGLLTIKDEERLKDFCSCKTSCTPSPCASPPSSCAACPQVKPPATWTPTPPPKDGDLAAPEFTEYLNRSVWYVAEGECNYILSLVHNRVLHTHGGRISLDLHDSLSFSVSLRSISQHGRIMMYRPLLVVTNSNPTILHIEKDQHLQEDPQTIQLMLSPTGVRKGVAVITVRSVVTSLKCQQSTSITLIVLIQREYGRRLHADYPIAICKPNALLGRYPRPWVVDREGCVRTAEITDRNITEIIRYHAGRQHVAYVTLPPNYRPPSIWGTDIPLTHNVYNVDPSKPAYKAWYRVSRETAKLNQCKDKRTKEECACKDVDKISDDEFYSDCKEKVFRAHRAKSIKMAVDYDRVMRDVDQNPEFFTRKLNWSVYIDEVNGRTEWVIINHDSPYLDTINSNEEYNNGKKHYNMRGFNVTVFGTGLFHFRVTLGKFESFDDVTGYFMIYADPNELNHIHMFMILLLTILFSFTMVFIGFLVVRKRLSGQLPIQPMSHKKKLKLM